MGRGWQGQRKTSQWQVIGLEGGSQRARQWGRGQCCSGNMDLPTIKGDRKGSSPGSPRASPGPDPEQGWGSGFCSPLGTCKVSRLGRWEDPRELQLSRKECSLNERHGGRGELPAKKGD